MADEARMNSLYISPFAISGYAAQMAKNMSWHRICTFVNIMVAMHKQTSEFNVLVSGANWAWPEALRSIFQPRDIGLLVAEKANEFVEVIRRRRIHAAIVDMDSEAVALATVKIIRMDYPLLPCIMLTSQAGKELLSKALELDVFSVIEKPVNMKLLQMQLNKLFLKRYNSNIFAS